MSLQGGHIAGSPFPATVAPAGMDPESSYVAAASTTARASHMVRPWRPDFLGMEFGSPMPCPVERHMDVVEVCLQFGGQVADSKKYDRKCITKEMFSRSLVVHSKIWH